jgi:hypothetical protein
MTFGSQRWNSGTMSLAPRKTCAIWMGMRLISDCLLSARHGFVKEEMF